MHGLSPHHFCGIDWASDKHDVCIIDPAGKICTKFCIPHTADGIADLIRRLDALGPREQMPILIERPSGLLVDTLLDARFPLAPIHPNALKATRPRYSAAQGKADPSDAFIAADVLRTDGHRFPLLRALRASPPPLGPLPRGAGAERERGRTHRGQRTTLPTAGSKPLRGRHSLVLRRLQSTKVDFV
jgi:hypothetical protein